MYEVQHALQVMLQLDSQMSQINVTKVSTSQNAEFMQSMGQRVT